jgi:hypothetical protein
MFSTMNNQNYDIDASCGGKRRGCCIIELPHDAEPADIGSDSFTQRILLIVPGLSAGRPPTWAVVSVSNPEATNHLGEATR